ncbi:SCO4225 family membrane protein [Saccharopolyspora sp. MS10]|uniref:SCO4225 family membrane protein n=1 Tax=Saccharopolyspora sp. MS10 TaxID=3385973 RepID=UPI0039A3981E
MSASSPLQAPAFRRYLLNPVSLGYLALVAAVWIWVALDVTLVEHADATLSGVWGLLVTAPTSLLFLGLPGPLPWIGVVVAALVQATALGLAYQGTAGIFRRRVGTTGA